MRIDLKHEEILSLKDAANSIPAIDGKSPHLSTVWRWARKGLNGVRLDYVRIGRRVCTSREAINRFVNALAEKDAESLSRAIPPRSPDVAKTSRVRQAQKRDANRALDEQGL